MAGLNHDFILLNCAEHPVENWQGSHNSPNAIQIHDDVLQYVADTLKWIPTYNPATKLPSLGLSWDGPTVIQENGAIVAAKVFATWADLFSCGPNELRLTGPFSWQLENDPAKDGFDRVVPGTAKYESLILSRDEVTMNLRTVASYAERIHETRGAYYILHFGI